MKETGMHMISGWNMICQRSGILLQEMVYFLSVCIHICKKMRMIKLNTLGLAEQIWKAAYQKRNNGYCFLSSSQYFAHASEA